MRRKARKRRQTRDVVDEGHCSQRERGAERRADARLDERAGRSNAGGDGDAARARHGMRVQGALVRPIEREPPAGRREQQPRDQQCDQERGNGRQREHGAHSSCPAHATTLAALRPIPLCGVLQALLEGEGRPPAQHGSDRGVVDDLRFDEPRRARDETQERGRKRKQARRPTERAPEGPAKLGRRDRCAVTQLEDPRRSFQAAPDRVDQIADVDEAAPVAGCSRAAAASRGRSRASARGSSPSRAGRRRAAVAGSPPRDLRAAGAPARRSISRARRHRPACAALIELR